MHTYNYISKIKVPIRMGCLAYCLASLFVEYAYSSEALLSPDRKYAICATDFKSSQGPALNWKIISLVDLAKKNVLLNRVTDIGYIVGGWSKDSSRCIVAYGPDNASADLWLFLLTNQGVLKSHPFKLELLIDAIEAARPDIKKEFDRSSVESISWPINDIAEITLLHNNYVCHLRLKIDNAKGIKIIKITRIEHYK